MVCLQILIYKFKSMCCLGLNAWKITKYWYTIIWGLYGRNFKDVKENGCANGSEVGEVRWGTNDDERAENTVRNWQILA